MRCLNLSELPPSPDGKSGWPWNEQSNLTSNTTDQHQEFPLVSIVTPSFNQGQFIEETIRSVLLQGYPNLEYIIIDGGSTDNSVEIIKKYEPWIAYWVSEKDRGQSHAINKGFKLASGQVFGWLNADDVLAENALFNLMTLRSEKPNCIAWVGACQKVDADGKPISFHLPRTGGKREIANWARQVWFSQPSCLFDANAFRAIGGITERLEYVMDVDLWMRLSEIGDFASTDINVSFPRIHSGMKTLRDIPMREAEHIFIDLNLGLPDVAQSRMRRYLIKEMDRMPLANLMGYVTKRFLNTIWNKTAARVGKKLKSS